MPTCKILSFLPLALFIFCGECDELYEQVGGEVTMNCGIPPNRDVEWKLNDILIIKIRSKTGTKLKGTSHISGKVIVDGGILKVPKLETRDSGLYSCQSGKQYNLYVVSVFAKPGPVVVQSSAVELHCDVPGKSKSEVHWLSPSKDEMKKQVIELKSVTSKDEGQWMCVFKNLNISLTLTVVAGLQTTAVEVPEGDNTTLPCSLPRSVSQRVVGGTWTADHLPTESFPTLKNSEEKGLHWNSEKSSRITFTSEKLSINYDVTLTNAQREDEGRYVCKVEFEGGAKLTAKMNLTVLAKLSGKSSAEQEVKRKGKGKGKTSTVDGPWEKEVLGLQLWIWIAVVASSVFLLGLIIMTVVLWQKNKRKEKRAKKLRSLRQPLTARDYCQCSRGESEVQLVEQEKPLPMPRQQRNPRTRTAGANHTVEKSREQDYY